MTRTDLSGYEQRLLSELRTLVTERAARPASVPAAPRRRRPRLAAAAVAGLAAIAGLAVLTGGDRGGTAYAVERQADGAVTVEIKRLEDAAGLEQQLRAHGIPAEVDYLPAGTTCADGRFTPARAEHGRASLMQRADGSATFSLHARDLRPGQTLVITSSSLALPDGGRSSSIAMAVAQGDVAPCEPVAAPDPSLPALPGGGAR